MPRPPSTKEGHTDWVADLSATGDDLLRRVRRIVPGRRAASSFENLAELLAVFGQVMARGLMQDPARRRSDQRGGVCPPSWTSCL